MGELVHEDLEPTLNKLQDDLAKEQAKPDPSDRMIRFYETSNVVDSHLSQF